MVRNGGDKKMAKKMLVCGSLKKIKTSAETRKIKIDEKWLAEQRYDEAKRREEKQLFGN